MKSILSAIVFCCLCFTSCKKNGNNVFNFARKQCVDATLLGADLTQTACSGGQLVEINGTIFRTFSDFGKINGIFNVADIAFPSKVKICFKERSTDCGIQLEISSIVFK